MAEFIDVVSKTTKQKQRIPEDWLAHPVLGRDFELPPSARTGEPGGPSDRSDQTLLPVDEDSTADELLQYAADNQIDISDAQDEAEALAAIRLHHESTSSVEKE